MAREAFESAGKKYEFFDVSSDVEKLNFMLTLTGGKKRIPVIIENGKTILGFKGKT